MAKKRRVSNCSRKGCKGKYVLSYENGAPIFTCSDCGDQNLRWKQFYDEYLGLYAEKSNWDQKKHQVSCIIGFFCRMYKDFYGTNYVFVPKNPNPYGSKEVRDSWSLLAAFDGDAHLVRKYIYWLFKKVIRNSTNITSFGYIVTPALIRKYKLMAQKRKILSRETGLPKAFRNWCQDNAPAVLDNYSFETLNDLGAILAYSQTLEQDGPESLVVRQAEKLGLIKNGKINIGGSL